MPSIGMVNLVGCNPIHSINYLESILHNDFNGKPDIYKNKLV